MIKQHLVVIMRYIGRSSLCLTVHQDGATPLQEVVRDFCSSAYGLRISWTSYEPR
jgi:hypothetical protein